MKDSDHSKECTSSRLDDWIKKKGETQTIVYMLALILKELMAIRQKL